MPSKVIQWIGQVIKEPGIYKGVPLDLYHSKELFGGVPAISSSGLRKIFNPSSPQPSTPAHYWANSPYNPDRADEDGDEKKSYIRGRALHHLVGAEKGFKESFVIRPEKIPDIGESIAKPWQGNRIACKTWLEAMKSEGKTVLTPEDVELLKGMALSLGKHPLVSTLSGQIEHSYFWRDKETGIWLKWRPDSTPTDSADFVDLKGTVDVRWFKLMKTISDYGYHMQGALGRAACRELLGYEMNSFSLFFIEWKAPWCTSFVPLKAVDLDLGERMNRAALRLFWKCWKEKSWPGPEESDGIGLTERARESAINELHTLGL